MNGEFRANLGRIQGIISLLRNLLLLKSFDPSRICSLLQSSKCPVFLAKLRRTRRKGNYNSNLFFCSYSWKEEWRGVFENRGALDPERSEVGFPRLIPNPLREKLVTVIATRGDSRILFFPLKAILDESKRKLTQCVLSITPIIFLPTALSPSFLYICWKVIYANYNLLKSWIRVRRYNNIVIIIAI